MTRFVPDGKSGVVVLLIGPTGVGKSHFINVAAGKEVAAVYHGLADGSRTVEAYPVQNPHSIDHGDPDPLVILVDSPGLGSCYVDDRTILQMIRNWIINNRDSEYKFGGILYLREITSNRDHPIESLLSPENPERLQLVTSNWDQQGPAGRFDQRTFEKREQCLIKVWRKKLLDTGAKYHRFRNPTRDVAWGILNGILKLEPLPVRTLAEELEKIERSLSKTGRKTGGAQWKVTIRNLLPRLPTTRMWFTTAQGALSKRSQSRGEPFPAIYRPNSMSGTEFNPQSRGVANATSPHPACATASVLPCTEATQSDTESVYSITETEFFSVTETHDSEEDGGLGAASPEPSPPGETETLSQTMAVETITISISVNTPTEVSSVSIVAPGSTAVDSEFDFFPIQVQSSASTATTNPSLAERNLISTIENILGIPFPSANGVNIQNLHLTVNVYDQDVPSNLNDLVTTPA